MMEDGDEEEETEEIINQVLDEIGINLSNQLVDAPQNKVEQKVDISDSDLESRLENLKRD